MFPMWRNRCFLFGSILDDNPDVFLPGKVFVVFRRSKVPGQIDPTERENAIYLRTAEALGVSLEKSHCWASRSASDQALGESQVAG
jgi:hypothetical protein